MLSNNFTASGGAYSIQKWVSVINFSDLRPATPPPLSVRLSKALESRVRAAHELLCVTGAVGDTNTYPERHLAKTRAQRLLALLVAFGFEERWALRERTWRVDGGWKWSVEQIGASDD